MARTDSTPGVNHLVIKRQEKSGNTWYPTKDYVLHNDYLSTWRLRDDIQFVVPESDGWQMPTSYSSEGRIVGSGIISQIYWQGYLNGTLCHNLGSGTWGAFVPQVPEVVLAPSTKARKINELMSKMADQKWNATESLLQARETVGLIGGKAAQLQRALLAASRGRWKTVAAVLQVKPKKLGSHGKDISSGWLAYQFGWAPIVGDISNALIFLAELERGSPLSIMAKVSASLETEEQVSSKSYISNISYGLLATVSHVDRIVHREDWKASCYASLDIPSLKHLADHGAVGLATPWAMVPWSFVVDWVLPIGDALAALDARIGLSFRGGSETSFIRSTATRKSTTTWSPAATHGSWNHLDWTPSSKWKMVRTAWESFPLPRINYLKDPLDVWHAVTAIALLGSTHKSHWKLGGH